MCLHGDKSQPERDWVLSGEFCNYLSPFLCACVIFIFTLEKSTSECQLNHEQVVERGDTCIMLSSGK